MSQQPSYWYSSLDIPLPLLSSCSALFFYFLLENSFGIMTFCMCALKIALTETEEVLQAF